MADSTPPPPPSSADIAQLPQEVLESVFGFLDAPSLLTVPGVCRSWRALAKSGAGERLWRAQFFEEAQISPTARVVVEDGVVRKRSDGSYHPGEAQVFWQAALAVTRAGKLPTTFVPHPNGEVVINEQEASLQVSPQFMERYAFDRVVKADHPFPNFYAVPFYPTFVCTRQASEQAGPTFTLGWLSCCYYEVELLQGEQGNRDCLAVGLTPPGFPDNRRQPGWNTGSFGYHSDDGNRFHERGIGEEYGPAFGPGDIVGCGIVLGGTPRVFWTHNGRFLGVIDGELGTPGVLFATLGVSLKGATAFNFGSRPFRYNLLARDWEDDEDEQQRATLLRDLSWVTGLANRANEDAASASGSDGSRDGDSGDGDDDDEFARVRAVLLGLEEEHLEELLGQGIEQTMAFVVAELRRQAENQGLEGEGEGDGDDGFSVSDGDDGDEKSD